MPLAFLGMLIGRRRGDRLQAQLVLALGLLVLAGSVAGVIEGSPYWVDWLGIPSGVAAIGLALVLLYRLRPRT